MRVVIDTELEASAERVWRELQRPQLLVHIAKPLQIFDPVSPPEFPSVWAEGDYLVKLKSLGFVPTGRQNIRIRYPDGADPGAPPYRLRDAGGGDLAKVWDHMITITPIAQERCAYQDAVDVRAGALTIPVWAFAQLFYRWRQFRWRRLVRRGFEYH